MTGFVVGLGGNRILSRNLSTTPIISNQFTKSSPRHPIHKPHVVALVEIRANRVHIPNLGIIIWLNFVLNCEVNG